MKNIIMESIEQLKKNPFHTYVWGGGVGPSKVTKFYREHGVKIECNLVGRKYFQKGMLVEGIEAECLEDFLDNLKHPINLIVGFGYDDKHDYNILNNRNIDRLILADFSTAFVLGLDNINIYDDEFWEKYSKEILALRDEFEDDKSKAHFDVWVFQKRLSFKYKDEYTQDVYFPKDIIKLEPNEIFVDCGAFRGENSEEFLRLMESEGKEVRRIVMFEPDSDNCSYIKKYFHDNHDVTLVEKGCWSHAGKLLFKSNRGSESSFSNDGDIEIAVDSIDNVLDNDKATFIKMDIEGSELEALKGAENQIKNNRPKLAVCVYHRKEDIIMIPNYLRSLVPNYKFFFRNHCALGVESVLYAI